LADSPLEPTPAAQEEARPTVDSLVLSPVWYIEPTASSAAAPEMMDSNTLDYDPPNQWQTEHEQTEQEVIIASLPDEDNVLDFDFGDAELATEAVPVAELTPPPEPVQEPEQEPESEQESEQELAPEPELEIALDNFFASPKLELDDEFPSIAPKIDTQYENIAVFVVNNDANAPQRAEMDTKLGLAIEYQEIGYKEGARELINEVIQGGTPAQVEKAKEMLAKLA
jgi:pilus assembly protein FimV